MAQTYRNFAFISYKSQDRRWAEWLQRKLEYYRLPADIRRADIRLKKGIRPVFKDTTDLGVGNLDEGIREALADSRFLIVICSPNASKSKWVNKEVKEFIDSGRAADIIPFIIDGEPNSADPSRECFPEELRNLKEEHEIKAANVNEGGRNAAAVRVIARMFGLRFDELWQRYRRREMRRNLLIGALATLLIVAGLFVYDYFRVKTDYYMEYTLRHGMPEGVFKIKKSELRHYPAYYKFDSTRGKTVRITACDYWGQPMNMPPTGILGESPIIELCYENGKLSALEHKDASGSNIYKEVFASDDYTKVDLKESSSGDAASLFGSGTSMTEGRLSQDSDPMSFFTRGKANIGRYVYEYDDDGYITKKMFKRYNGRNEPGYDNNGIAGFAFTFGSLHRIISVTYLDADEKPCTNKFGIMREEMTYDENSVTDSHRYFGADGELRLNELGYAFCTVLWEPESATATTSYFGTNEEAVISRNLAHKEVEELRENGHTFYAFGIDGRPSICNNISMPAFSNFHKAVYERDKEGRIVAQSFYDVDGQPCYVPAKIHKTRLCYSSYNKPDSIVFLDTDGSRKNCMNGFAKTSFSYDKEGNTQSESYYDYAGRPVYVNGAQYLSMEYSNRRLVKISAFGHNFWPAGMMNYGGAHSVEIGYDSDGNTESVKFLDGTGALMEPLSFGFAEVKAKYSNGNLASLTSYDPEGNIVEGISGYAVAHYRWDEKGNRTAEEFFDSNMQPAYNQQHVARAEYSFDQGGNCTEVRCYDTDGSLKISDLGFAICKNEYDGTHLISQSSFGTKAEPIMSQAGIHRIRYEYDNLGRQTFISFYDTMQNPAIRNDGVHATKMEYDAFGNISAMYNIGTDGEPCNNKDGVARQQNTYDKHNNRIKEEYFDAGGKLTNYEAFGYALALSKFDSRGNCIEMAAYDSSGKPTDCKAGYHKAITRYNDEGLPLIMCTYDADGKYAEVLNSGLWISKNVNIYDDSGTSTCNAKFDADGDAAFIGAQYNEKGTVACILIRQGYFGDIMAQYPDGRQETYPESFSYRADDELSDEEKRGKVYRHYLDSIAELAKHIYDDIERAAKPSESSK